ncbi:hypothetical protein ABZ816_35335 [Actinosynnema sp. NPDC047251]|uniref:Uncharacterized protein n=1 Tax=Saccharothrix espanaensis (strain ATCC 51144 / DSM 44229 / JCM 9112 / NBRC 15066 / NRRL 15764) TaxID=1179773 RepID=K0JUQ4_SACES|nr:hypothetical protein [Saccharothrix espanaensis]CCH29242.1 hypothetical protein BN6_19220 [Saccharothrix espanaensis DSM 44229]
MTEQRRSTPTDRESDLIRRIRNLARRAERTAFNHSNLVGPPPSQEHLDILAEIRALTEQVVAARPATLPRQAESVETAQLSAPVL